MYILDNNSQGYFNQLYELRRINSVSNALMSRGDKHKQGESECEAAVRESISANGGGRTVTPQQEVGERVHCSDGRDTMAYIIINYSWLLSLPRAGRVSGTMPGCT